jgi:hypothetical protein
MRNSFRYSAAGPLAGCLCAWLLLFGVAAQGAGRGEMVAGHTRESTAITFKLNSQPVLTYNFAPTQYKPYVSELYTPGGLNVLRDAPVDHHHHHGLMYGIKVNGINFWEEISGSGVQRVLETVTTSLKTNRLPGAVIRQKLAWLPAADAFLPASKTQPLLIEHRTLTVTVDPERGETALLWHAVFDVPGRTNEVILSGSSYHGLGMRFPAEFDPVAIHLSPGGNPDFTTERHVVDTHPWQAVLYPAGASSGKSATVAIFGSSSNTRGQPAFFSMRAPFSYLSATQALDKEPLVYRSGDRFELSYLIVANSGLLTIQQLRDLARRTSTLGFATGNDQP